MEYFIASVLGKMEVDAEHFNDTLTEGTFLGVLSSLQMAELNS